MIIIALIIILIGSSLKLAARAHRRASAHLLCVGYHSAMTWPSAGW
ncbi:hypothetical protein [Cryobacterium serini]|nr:hypothetical protein [Cryobacterium serini]